MALFRRSSKPEEESAHDSRDLQDLQAAIEKAQLPESVRAVTAKEMERLNKTDPSIPEYTIGLNYIEYLHGACLDRVWW
jgi:ATP-dependent Lon protease